MKPTPLAIQRALRMAAPFWRGMLLSALLGALTIGSSLALMATSSWLISTASFRISIADLSVAVVGVRFFGISRGVLRYCERLVSHEVTFRLLAAWRVRFYSALEAIAPAGLSAHQTGDLLSRAIDDVQSLENLYLRGAAPLFVAAVVTLGLTAFLGLFHPWLGAAVLAFIALVGLGLPFLAWQLNHKSAARRTMARAGLGQAALEAIQGLPESLLYGQTAAQMQKMAALDAQMAAAERLAAWTDGLQLALSLLFSAGAALTVLLIAIPRIDRVLLATVTLSTLAGFEAYAPLAQAALQLGATGEAARRLFEIVDAPNPVRSPEAPRRLPERLDLEFVAVDFHYEPGRKILAGLSLRIPYGRRIAILGASGVGKSTIAHLLIRFWDCSAGQIRLGSCDLRDLDPIQLRRLIGILPQRTYLFNDTIRANIRLARPNATDGEVEQAAQQAAIHAAIQALPAGYDTLVGENGAALSGGERQRVALARLLLQNPAIFILDEATANLDPATERAVMTTILRATAGKTLIVLTHRRGMLKDMDDVYVLSELGLRPYTPAT